MKTSILRTSVVGYNSLPESQCTEVQFASFFSGGFITAISSKSTGEKTGKTHLCAVRRTFRSFKKLAFRQSVVRNYARVQFRRSGLKRAKNQFANPHYLSLLWIFSIVCNVIVHHNNYILIGYSMFVNNLVGMANVSLMPIIPVTIATSDQDDPDFSAIGNFIFSRQIWTLYRNQLIHSVEFFYFDAICFSERNSDWRSLTI